MKNNRTDERIGKVEAKDDLRRFDHARRSPDENNVENKRLFLEPVDSAQHIKSIATRPTMTAVAMTIDTFCLKTAHVSVFLFFVFGGFQVQIAP